MTLIPEIQRILNRDDSINNDRVIRSVRRPYKDKVDVGYDLVENDFITTGSDIVGVNNEIERVGVDLSFVEGVQAIRQWVHKALKVEAGIYPIYTDRYGFDLIQIIGKEISNEAIQLFLPLFIERTLLYHPHITSVDRVVSTVEGVNLSCSFDLTLDDENIVSEDFTWVIR